MDAADERDAAIDARLRAAFAPPRDVQRMARDVLERSGVVEPPSRWTHLRSVAAILIVAAGLSWFALRDASPSPVLASMDATQLHAQLAAVLGEPMSCISPEEESRSLVTQSAGSVGSELAYRGGGHVPLQGPLTLPVDWPGDPAATAFAGHSEGRVVVVVIETVELTCGPSLESTEEHFVHRRELGGYVLLEISSGEVPVCLDAFSLGDSR